MATETFKLQGARGKGWAVLVALTLGTAAACTDAGTQEPAGAKTDPLIPVAQTLTPGEVLGIQQALATTAALEASVAYKTGDARIAELTNRITNARIAQEDRLATLAANYGVTPVASPTSNQIYAQSARDVAYLRTVGAASLDEAYVSGFVLTSLRAMGAGDRLLLPNSGPEWLRGFVFATYNEWAGQLVLAQNIQRAQNDWRFNTAQPERTGPIAPRPGSTIPGSF